jgi:hypothetical protein
MVDESYNPRRHRTPLPKDDDSTQIREVAKLIANKVKEDLDDEQTRRMPAMSGNTPSGEFHVAVISQLAALNAKMAVVDEIKATTNTLRDKQQEVLVALARGDGRMNGLDQGMETINSRVDGVIEEIRGTNNRLDRIERGESSSIHKAVKEPRTESTKKTSWVSGAKALAIVIVAVGTAIAAVVTVIVKTQAPAAPVANQEPAK